MNTYHHQENPIRTQIIFVCHQIVAFQMLIFLLAGGLLYGYLIVAVVGDLFFGLDLPIRAVLFHRFRWSDQAGFLAAVASSAPGITLLLDDRDNSFWWFSASAGVVALFLLLFRISGG